MDFANGQSLDVVTQCVSGVNVSLRGRRRLKRFPLCRSKREVVGVRH